MFRRKTVWDEMRQMQSELNKHFNNFFKDDTLRDTPLLEATDGKSSFLPSSYSRPLADLVEHEDKFVAVIELPGIRKDDIDINVTSDGISITAERMMNVDEKRGTRRVIERSYKGFNRYFSFPTGVDKDRITASYRDGLLELSIPKKEEEKGKKVTVA